MGPHYRVLFAPRAVRDLRRLPQRNQRQVVQRIEDLARDPRPSGAKPIQAKDGFLRLRIGQYRLIYQVDDREHLVRIVKVGHRREVYRDL